MNPGVRHAPSLAPGRRWAVVFGLGNLVAAALVAIGVFEGLPDRYAPVDAAAAVLLTLLGAAGVGLLAQLSWAKPVAEIASAVSLGLGLFVVGALVVSASYLAGVYGPVGRGGAVIFVLVVALAVPYLIALPAIELAWLRSLRPAASRGAPRHGAGS